MNSASINADPREIEKFAALAPKWWDQSGEFKTLHRINPTRIAYLQNFMELRDRRLLDVGCGGGILSEGLAQHGAQVTGIDLAEASLEVARLHLYESGLTVDYRQVPVEQLAEQEPSGFDAAVCMEMLEHVPNPDSVIHALAALVKPGGWVFLSTLNRHPKAYLLAVLGAEYLLNLLPRGTHDYAHFIKPSELTGWCRSAGLVLRDISGMRYNPLNETAELTPDVKVNYLMACQRPL
jgi:2-polyprenyl-6-hydroxyphenyl methylase/3-demethylubiquinone-9 3-methyltransferase